MGDLELVVDAKATLGEGPSWDAEKQCLYWVDIEERKVHIYDPRQNADRTIDVPQRVGAVAPRQSGGLVAALHDGIYGLDTENGQVTLLARPPVPSQDVRFNDGKCDAAGRFLAGTMSMSGVPNAGSLYHLDASLSLRTLVERVTVSNGLAWSPDNRILYYIDSPTKQVMAYDYDLQTGSLGSPRVVVRIPEGEGVPDGMTADAEGMLWVAQWDGYRVSRWNPHTGERMATIQVPAARVTSCVFGGEGLDELYITTAATGLTEQQRKEQPLAGGLFRIKTGVKGAPTFTFGG